MFALLAATAAAAQPVPKPLNPASWITPADYPAEAIRERLEGTLAFRVDVDEQGRVVGCTITESSKSSILDSSTCRLVARRARFEPARDAKGKPVRSTWSNRVKWKVPLPPTPSPGLVVTTIEVAPDGKVERCSTEASGAVPPPVRDSVCRGLAMPGPAQMLKVNAPAYRTIRVATAISYDAQKFAYDGSAWGTLLMRRASDLELGADGRPLRCTVKAAVGGRYDDDICTRTARILPAPAEAVPQPTHLLTIDTAIFGIKR